MPDKSVPQLNALASPATGDLLHIVRSNIDYKILYEDLKSGIIGGVYGSTTFFFKLEIASADILTLNSTPIVVVAAPGAGYAIKVIEAAASLAFNTTDYGTNTTLQLFTGTGNTSQFNNNTTLNSIGDRFTDFGKVASSGTSVNQLKENEALKITVGTGNPTGGDSDIIIYGSYRIITL